VTRADITRFVHAVRDSDEAVVDDAVTRLSRVRPWLAPLTFAVGAFAMLFDGVRLVFTNWRLTLVQVLPAMWIWAAMYDLKLHLSPWHDKKFHVLTGPVVVIPIVLGIAAITAAAFYLNAVFAYAIIQPGRPQIRPAFIRARSHLGIVLGSGSAVGIGLGLSAVVADRWGTFWFGLSLHSSLHPGPRRTAHARVEGALPARRHLLRRRADAGGRSNRSGQGGQDERQTRLRA